MEIDQSFVFNQIRKYNQASRQVYRDKALLAIGTHTGLLKKSKALVPELNQAERRRVLYFARQFLKANKCQAEIEG
jgi:hypothetical protein